MNPDFEIHEFHGCSMLIYTPWHCEGIVHGMTIGPLSFGDNAVQDSVRVLCNAAGATELCLPEQVHGDRVLDLRRPESIEEIVCKHGSLLRTVTADAIVCGDKQPIAARRIAFGVSTADCVPLVLRGKSGWAVVHAGWRGLANGVIYKALAVMEEASEGVVFAAAGPRLYEVGAEVIEAIGSCAVFTRQATCIDRYLLDPAATAIRQLRIKVPSVRTAWAGICTIEDDRFHSHRRQPAGGGRAVTFVCPPSS